MFERRVVGEAVGGVDAADRLPDADTLAGWLQTLAGVDGSGSGDGAQVEVIRGLEELKSAAAAAQARVSVCLDATRRSQRAAAGVHAAEQGKAVAAEIALARRESPTRGAQHLGLAKTLVGEMPHGLAALSTGWISEWRATLVARETACLSVEHRSQIDAALFGDPDRLTQVQTWGDRRLVAETRTLAYRLDPHSALARVRKAENDRRVTCRPAPDTMAYLSGLLPVAQAVACYAALNRAADTARAQGDPRSRGQVMADTMVELLTGQTIAAGTPVEIQLVVTDQTLFANTPNYPANTDPTDTTDDADAETGQARSACDDAEQGEGADTDSDSTAPAGSTDAEPTEPAHRTASAPDLPEQTPPPAPPPFTRPAPDAPAGPFPDTDPRHEPAYLPGYGPVRPDWARRLITDLPDPAKTWIRRVFADPATGELVAMDSKRREFPPGIRHAVVLRDQTCRMPWCDAPIRHGDHVIEHTDHGPTSLANAQGLCEACNYTKQAAGWTARPGQDPTGAHTVATTTPTGHTYHSTAPPLPGARAPDPAPARAAPPPSRLETYLTDLILEYAA